MKSLHDTQNDRPCCTRCGRPVPLTKSGKRRGRRGTRQFCRTACKNAFFGEARANGLARHDACAPPTRNWRTNSERDFANGARSGKRPDEAPASTMPTAPGDAPTPGDVSNLLQSSPEPPQNTPWYHFDQEILRRTGRKRSLERHRPPAIPVLTVAEACARMRSPLPTLDPNWMVIAPLVDESLAQQMAQFIVGIVKQIGDANHEALTRKAEDHGADDVAILLDLCGVIVPGEQVIDKLTGAASFEANPGVDLAAFVKPYIPVLARAKQRAAVELAGGEKVTPADEAANNKPAGKPIKPPKAPRARRVQRLP